MCNMTAVNTIECNWDRDEDRNAMLSQRSCRCKVRAHIVQQLTKIQLNFTSKFGEIKHFS